MESVLTHKETRKPLYSAYMILKQSRRQLLKLWDTKYEKVIAHHVTVQFGDVTKDDVPEEARIEVVGYVDSMDGLEALIVSVNGEIVRPDGKTYHITLSLDPSKYAPMDSNQLIADKGFIPLDQTIHLAHIKPSVVFSHAQ